MKKLLLISAAALLVTTGAFAESTVVTTTGKGHVTVRIEPEYRSRIHTYVTEHRIPPVETRERIVVGDFIVDVTAHCAACLQPATQSDREQTNTLTNTNTRFTLSCRRLTSSRLSVSLAIRLISLCCASHAESSSDPSSAASRVASAPISALNTRE